MFFEDGDIVLRSSDNFDFYLHCVILRHASPLFRDVFTLPRPRKEDSDAIMISEDSLTLDTLLHWVYPTAEKPVLSSIEMTGCLVEVAENKLLFEYAVPPLKAVLASLIDSVEHPLHGRGYAIRYNLPDVRKTAFKRYMLADSLMDPKGDMPELEGILARALWKLQATRSGLIRAARVAAAHFFAPVPAMKTHWEAMTADMNTLTEVYASDLLLENCYWRTSRGHLVESDRARFQGFRDRIHALSATAGE